MRALLQLELTTLSGDLILVRQAHNAVMRSGAQLLAGLFAGQGKPITHMGVGTSDAPETDAYATEKLSNDASQGFVPLQGVTESVISPEAFFPPEVDETRRIVRVRVRGTLPAAAAVGTVREAGLLSRTGEKAILYNRVTFAPIPKGNDHELTLFWEISFPYGDLQWF